MLHFGWVSVQSEDCLVRKRDKQTQSPAALSA